MTIATFPMSIPSIRIPSIRRRASATTVTPSHRCTRDGKVYPTEFDCPCWTALPEARRTDLASELTAWFSGFEAARV